MTTGAAGGIVAGTAGAIAWKDCSLVPQLPLPATTGIEVIRQKFHHDCYDRQVTACGVKLVDVESREDLERPISSRTAIMFSSNFLEGESTIDRSAWIDVVRRRNLQTTKTIRRAVRPKDCSKTQFSVFARRAVNRYVVGMLMQCVKQVG